MSTTAQKALELADRLQQDYNSEYINWDNIIEAADELRRLSAENEALRTQVEALKKEAEFRLFLQSELRSMAGGFLGERDAAIDRVEALTRPAAPDAKAMANRLMGWKLPKNFSPDCFISFDRAGAEACGAWPVGTNLFMVDQATEMFEYVLAAVPQYEVRQRQDCSTCTHNKAPFSACDGCDTAVDDSYPNWEQEVQLTEAAQPANLWAVVEAHVSEVTGGDSWVQITIDANSKPAPHLKSLLADKVALLAAQKGGV